MSIPILVTKFFVPAARPELVLRPRLIEQLNGGLHRKLTLISAPAGFGKTTVVTEWLDNLQGNTHQEKPTNIRIAWLSLDESENNPARFLTYFIAALNQIDGLDALGDGSLTMLQSPQLPPIDAILTLFINDLAAIPSRIIFVLDDYHLIDTQTIQDILSFLLENLPPQLHLVITTREDPLLPLPRLRSRGQLTELRAADLRFTFTEAAEFLNQVMGLDLSTEDIVALEARTEGWIAGLQLAALSLRGNADTTQRIQSFTGSNRLVLDYLIEEVLNQQPENIQNFLLQTAVLDRLTGSLCDAVRFDPEDNMANGRENGQVVLERLERANLFIIPLDEERSWYRYHHLFADLLWQRLRQTQPDLESVLHIRASEWYEQNGFTDEAIEHALRADDYKRAANLIEEQADAIWGQGAHNRLWRWLVRLPDEWRFAMPRICVLYAWNMFATGQQEEAERSIQAAEHALDLRKNDPHQIEPHEQVPLSDSELKQLKGRLAAIRSMIGSWWEDVPEIIQHASIALEYLPKNDPWRGSAAVALGDAYLFKGDMTAAYQAQLEAVESCKATGNTFFIMIANMKVASCLRELGQLEQTIEICQKQWEIAKENGLSKTIIVGWVLGLWAISLAERNELDRALELVTKSVELTQGKDLSFVGASNLFLAKVLFYRGDLAGAEATFQKLENIALKHYLPLYISEQMAAWQARIMIAKNQPAAVSRWVKERGLDPDGELTSLKDYVIVVLARILLFQGRYDEATRLLLRLLAAAEAGEHTAAMIEILVLQALTFQAEDNKTQALNALMRAITLAKPGGYVRIFVGEGPPIARLLYEILSRGIAPDYVQQLLAAFPDTEPEQAVSSKDEVLEDEWIEPLSKRELEVLQFVADGLTNQEVASRLYLSLNTVKAHTRTIYSKLGVNSRTQAVARARILGIIVK